MTSKSVYEPLIKSYEQILNSRIRKFKSYFPKVKRLVFAKHWKEFYELLMKSYEIFIFFLNVVKFSDLIHLQPVRTSLPFPPFGVQLKPYTSESVKRAGCPDGWVRRWVGIKRVIRFFFFLSRLTSKLC